MTHVLELLFFRMDRDETLLINYDEWRAFLLFNPSSDIRDIIHFWRHANVSEVPIVWSSVCCLRVLETLSIAFRILVIKISPTNSQ